MWSWCQATAGYWWMAVASIFWGAVVVAVIYLLNRSLAAAHDRRDQARESHEGQIRTANQGGVPDEISEDELARLRETLSGQDRR